MRTCIVVILLLALLGSCSWLDERMEDLEEIRIPVDVSVGLVDGIGGVILRADLNSDGEVHGLDELFAFLRELWALIRELGDDEPTTVISSGAVT